MIEKCVAQDRKMAIYNKYGVIVINEDEKMEVGKIYFIGTTSEFERYIKQKKYASN